MSDSVIDDICERAHLQPLIDMAREGHPIALRRLEQLAYGTANIGDVERFGAAWMAALIGMAERGGVGHLERGEDGLVFMPAAELPTAEEAWRRVQASWPEL